jgi:hypothetical protein
MPRDQYTKRLEISAVTERKLGDLTMAEENAIAFEIRADYSFCRAFTSGDESALSQVQERFNLSHRYAIKIRDIVRIMGS